MSQSFELSDKSKSLMQQYLASGEYASPSEVINASLRLLAQEKQKVLELKKAIQEGIDSGIAKDFSFEAFRQQQSGKYGE